MLASLWLLDTYLPSLVRSMLIKISTVSIWYTRTSYFIKVDERARLPLSHLFLNAIFLCRSPAFLFAHSKNAFVPFVAPAWTHSQNYNAILALRVTWRQGNSLRHLWPATPFPVMFPSSDRKNAFGEIQLVSRTPTHRITAKKTTQPRN